MADALGPWETPFVHASRNSAGSFARLAGAMALIGGALFRWLQHDVGTV